MTHKAPGEARCGADVQQLDGGCVRVEVMRVGGGRNNLTQPLEEWLEDRGVRIADQTLRRGIGSGEVRCEELRFRAEWLNALQNLAACIALGGSWESFCDTAASQNCVEDSFLARAMSDGIALRSHLMCHAEEGFYVAEQEDGEQLRVPVFDSSGMLPGGWVGSSKRLMEELLELCPVLQVDLRPLRGAIRRGGGFDLSSASVELLREAGHAALRRPASASAAPTTKSGTDLAKQQLRHTWFVLYEASRQSIATSSLVLLQSTS